MGLQGLVRFWLVAQTAHCDSEIFDLVTSLEKAEGKGTDFCAFCQQMPSDARRLVPQHQLDCDDV